MWRDFINRFGNVEIREFYGATEGNFSLLNYSGKIGAIGRDTFLNRVKEKFILCDERKVVSQ